MCQVEAFEEFRKKYRAEPPRKNADHSDELKLIGASCGLRYFTGAPANDLITGLPRSSGDRCAYLWVISPEEVPYAFKYTKCPDLPDSKELKHTNLTGGGNVHCGGELWFADEKSIVINGDSGRYGAQSNEQLDDAAAAFSQLGYRVATMGFDETGYPLTTLVGDPEWR